MNNLTCCFSTHNNLNYLKLAFKSMIENAKIVDSIIIYAENCDDGTNEWLNNLNPVINNINIISYIRQIKNGGIGSGINYVISKVNTEYFYLSHSDMVFPKGFDTELMKYFEDEKYKNKRLIVSGYRCEPNIWNNPQYLPGLISVDPKIFGLYYNEFKEDLFYDWSIDFSNKNKNKIIRNVGGAGGYLMKKQDWNYLGGNDPYFDPACYEDIDLDLRAQLKEFEFIMTCDTLLYHFGARGSWFPNDKIGIENKSQRQIESEKQGYEKWLKKWNDNIKYDNNHFIILTEKMKNHYELNKNNFLY